MPGGSEGRIPAAVDLARDEALLRLGRPAVRAAVLADRTLSLGVGQPEDGPLADRAAAWGIPVVRRGTGGTGVLHLPGDLAWSIVLPREDPRAGRDYVRAYARLGRATLRLVEGEGVAATWRASPGLSTEMCLLGARGEVLSAGDRILGGAAQHLTGRALLHHGVVSVECDRALEAAIFEVPPSILAARRAGLRELGVRSSSEGLAARLGRLLDRELGGAGAP